MPIPPQAPAYEITPSQFPVLIDTTDEEIVSIMTISRSVHTRGVYTNTKLDDGDILHLVNPKLNLSNTSENPSSAQIFHPWAKDVEGASSRLARLDFDSIVFQRATSNYIDYTGYLTGLAFYAPGEDNFFTHAVEKEVTEEEYYANWEYPYSPPRVSITGVNLPLKVEISIYFGDSVSMEIQRDKLRNN